MKINIINACSDLGVNVDGSRYSPIKVKEYLKNNESINKIIDVFAENVVKSNDKNDLEKNIEPLNRFDDKLYSIVKSAKEEGVFPLTIGGDHSVVIASALADISYEDSLGVIWVDTHPDFNTFETTTSGNIHGLPLATITNNNGAKLTKFHNGNFFRNENTVIIGARDIDPLEQVNLDKAKIKVYSTNDVKTKNIREIVQESIDIALNKTNGIHLSIDIDVLDPVIAPGISVGFRDGLTKEQLFEIVDVLMENKDKIKSIDVVEFNPLTDIDNKTLRITVELIERIIEKLKEL